MKNPPRLRPNKTEFCRLLACVLSLRQSDLTSDLVHHLLMFNKQHVNMGLTHIFDEDLQELSEIVCNTSVTRQQAIPILRYWYKLIPTSIEFLFFMLQMDLKELQ